MSMCNMIEDGSLLLGRSMFIKADEAMEIIVSPSDTLQDVLELLSKTALRMAIVVDDHQCVVGIITDGDLRVGLLGGATIQTSASALMNTMFISIEPIASDVDASILLRRHGISHLPVLDSERRLLGLYTTGLIDKQPMLENWVVIMAGGRGERLRPLTDTIPKPLVQVGGKALIDLVIEKCEAEGFHDFYISVNYLKEMIISHLGKERLNLIDIDFLIEDEPLGTGGSLTLLPEIPTKPILVMNSDVLHNVNLRKLIEFHNSEKSDITVCGRHFQTQIPFGVLEMVNGELVKVTEKPSFSHLVNAGIYVVSPEVLELLEPKKYADMPDLLERAIAIGFKVSVFPMHEFWLDVGTPESLETANSIDIGAS